MTNSTLLTQYIFGAQLPQILELEIDVNNGHATSDSQDDNVTAGRFLERKCQWQVCVTQRRGRFHSWWYLGWWVTGTHSPPQLWGTHSRYTSACWQPGCSWTPGRRWGPVCPRWLPKGGRPPAGREAETVGPTWSAWSLKVTATPTDTGSQWGMAEVIVDSGMTWTKQDYWLTRFQ